MYARIEAVNRLANESSPYLLQHADNPVDWYPWGEDALSRARAENLPILLSIGYSACHWCHVMAHESFEDEATAAVMNAHFVNVKVDREERPDLDKIYQLAHHLLTQQTGGWPLTIFLDPATLVPFFGGTYFPPRPRYQLPGFQDLLLRVSGVFKEKRAELDAQGSKLVEVLAQLNPTAPGKPELDDRSLLTRARDMLAAQYDAAEGGFGSAPKFPMPSAVERLLRHWAFARHAGDRDREALDMVTTTLTKMARGGIYDHLGGGFFRYATDRQWMVPHFEKMLYDNGSLLALYADALQIGGDALFEQAARETAGWLTRGMQHPDGGFYAALDADSEGEEGKFYLWRRDQAKRLLDDAEYLVVETLYGLDKPANVEGRWNLHRTDAWASVVERLGLERERADALLASAKRKLAEVRAERVRPGRDDKVLAAWNGLAVKGLARAGVVLGESVWIDAATRAVDFVRTRMMVDGVLHATWKDGHAKYPAYLDDYANLLDALLGLLEARWRDADAQFARTLADTVLHRFYDTADGGFFFTAHDHETLIHRPKPTMDEATPAGNGVLAVALGRLGHLFAETRYLDAAHATIRWARTPMEQYPAGHCTLLNALEAQVYPPELVIVRGATDSLAEWLAPCRQGYQPWRQSFGIPYDGVTVTPSYLPRLVSAEMRGRTVAYVCRGLTCSAPIDSIEGLQKAIGLSGGTASITPTR